MASYSGKNEMPPTPMPFRFDRGNETASPTSLQGIKGKAIFDPTGCYRYSLTRCWDSALPAITFVMLNPNRANAVQNDPSINRCIGFAMSWGYGQLVVVNLFGYRARNPRDLKLAPDPTGPENDYCLRWAIESSDMTILAWGNNGALFDAAGDFLGRWYREDFSRLGLTKLGQPKHPLYLRADVIPRAFSPYPHRDSRSQTMRH